MGAALEIYNDSGAQVDVEIVNTSRVNQATRKTMAAEEVWTIKRRKKDTKFLILVHKGRSVPLSLDRIHEVKEEDDDDGGGKSQQEQKDDIGGTDQKEKADKLQVKQEQYNMSMNESGIEEKIDRVTSRANWKQLITEYKQKIEIEPSMGSKVRISVASVVRSTERRKRSAAIRQEIMGIRTPLNKLCKSIGRRWLNCSGAVRKRLKCEEEGICYEDYVKEDRKQIQKTVAQIALDLKRTTPQSFRIRNKRSREPEDAKDVEKRQWFERMEQKMGGRQKCVEECTNILVGFVQRNIALGYAQGLNYVVYFLLGFLDSESVFWLLCTLVEDIRLCDFYAPVPSPLNGFQIEAKTLLEVAEITERNAISASGGVGRGGGGGPGTMDDSERAKRRSVSNVTEFADKLLSRGHGLIGMLTGRNRQNDLKSLLDAEDDNCEKIGGDLGVLYQKTTEWMIPLFLTVVPLHPCIMIIDNFYDLYPELEDAYPDPSAASEEAKKQGKDLEKVTGDVDSPTDTPKALRQASGMSAAGQEAWSIVEEYDVQPRMGSGEAMVYCTFLTTMDLIKSRLEDVQDVEARESFSKLFDSVALGLSCEDLKHGLECYADAVCEEKLLGLRAKYRNRLADRWNKSTDRLPMLIDDLRRCYEVKVSLEFLKGMHDDFQFLYKKSQPGMSRTEFYRLMWTFPSLFPFGEQDRTRSKKKRGRYGDSKLQSRAKQDAASAHSNPSSRMPSIYKHLSSNASKDSTGDKGGEERKVVGRVDVLEAIFDSADMDQGGYVSFKELVCTLAILCANNKTRFYRLIFDVFDDTKSGYLNSRNLMEMSRWMVERKFATQKREERESQTHEQKNLRRQDFRQLGQLLRSLDRSGNRKLSFPEFSKGIEKTPILKNRLLSFKTTMEEAKERLKFRTKQKKEQSQLDIHINSVSGVPSDFPIRCVLRISELPTRTAYPAPAPNPRKEKEKEDEERKEEQEAEKRKAQDDGDTPNKMGQGEAKNCEEGERPTLSKTATAPTAKQKPAKILWGPWETKYSKTASNAVNGTGKVDVKFRTNMTLEYGKSIERFQIAVELKRRTGVILVNEEELASGTYTFGELSREVWERQEPFDVTFPVRGPKASAKIHMTFCYKKEWDEEVKRNKQALENIQALFGTQMI